MKTKNIIFEESPEANAAYLHIGDFRTITETVAIFEENGLSVIVDRDVNGDPVGIEILY